jgi:hypothetical protein
MESCCLEFSSVRDKWTGVPLSEKRTASMHDNLSFSVMRMGDQRIGHLVLVVKCEQDVLTHKLYVFL